MDPRKFVYLSDYELPAFVYKKIGQFVVTPNTFVTYKFEHGLDFVPLIWGQWDTNPDFSNARDISGMDLDGLVAFTDERYVYFNYYFNQQQTVYFRVWGMTPPGYIGVATPISDDSRFIMNTDDEYLQIYMKGKVQPMAAPGPIIHHNLGYVPLTRVWIKAEWNIGNGQTTQGVSMAYSECIPGTDYPYNIMCDKNDLYIGELEQSGEAYYYIFTNEG